MKQRMNWILYFPTAQITKVLYHVMQLQIKPRVVLTQARQSWYQPSYIPRLQFLVTESCYIYIIQANLILYVVQHGLKFAILFLQSSHCWNYRHALYNNHILKRKKKPKIPIAIYHKSVNLQTYG